ncbi:MAG: hypothetical protein WCF60_20940 [Anaerobacillus sp.]
MILFGKISLPEQLLWTGCSLGIALLIIYMIEKKYWKSSSNSSLAYESILFFVLIWKGSLLFLDPGLVISSPLSLLYFTGGSYGFVIALILSNGYIGWKIWKDSERRRTIILLYAFVEINAVTLGLFTWWLNSGAFLTVFFHVMLLGLLYYVRAWRWKVLDLMIWGGIASIILEFIYGHPRVAGLSEWQWIYLMISGSASFIQFQLYTRRS